MSCPRNLYPDTTVFVTVRCVHESYRLVPTKLVRRVVDFCFAVVSTRYRNAYGMRFYEYEFLSTHDHLLSGNGCGRITDFLQDLNALIARELNAVRGTSGAFFDRAPGIQTVLGDGKVFEHCVFTLANAVAAGIVRRTARTPCIYATHDTPTSAWGRPGISLATIRATSSTHAHFGRSGRLSSCP